MLAAALPLFARHGFAQTSTAHVARQAGTSESQLIKHFGSKDGLLEALFDMVWADLNEEVEQLSEAHPDPIHRLKAIIALMLARIAAHAEVRRLMLFEGRRIRSRGPAVSAGFARFVKGIDALLQEAKQAGRLRLPLAPAAIRSMLIGACEGLMRDRQLAEDAGYPARYSPKDIERAMQALIAAFFTDAPVTSRRKGSLPAGRHRRRRSQKGSGWQKSGESS
jgi:AcrR family transcriptional regulator